MYFLNVLFFFFCRAPMLHVIHVNRSWPTTNKLVHCSLFIVHCVCVCDSCIHVRGIQGGGLLGWRGSLV